MTRKLTVEKLNYLILLVRLKWAQKYFSQNSAIDNTTLQMKEVFKCIMLFD